VAKGRRYARPESAENQRRYTGGTMNLTGDAAVNYEESGRGFESFDATGLNGDLTYTGADYAQENIELGGGAASISVGTEETDDAGVARGNMVATSTMTTWML